MRINLYDILQNVLKESVSPDNVADAINNKYQVIIKYDDKKTNTPQKRIIEPYVYGISKKGNGVVRAYQYTGGSVKWKLFRLDKIISWTPTNNHFNMPPDKRGWRAEAYNGNGDKSMTTVFNFVSFDDNEFSSDDRLNSLRAKTQAMKNSNPVNIYKQDDIEKQKKLQDMIKRNMEITNKEKEKRGFSMNNYNKNKGPVINATVKSITNNTNNYATNQDNATKLNNRNKYIQDTQDENLTSDENNVK